MLGSKRFAFLVSCALAATACESPASHPAGRHRTEPVCEDAPRAVPPAPGRATHPAATVNVLTFAVSKLYFGDTDRDGMPDRPNGWKNYGYDLDGRISGPGCQDEFEGLCVPLLNASLANAGVDGPGGIDNGFGKNI